MKQIQYTLIKIPIKELIRQEYNVTMDRQEEIKNEYLIAQGDSLLFDQIQRLRGSISSHIEELILVVAKKNPKQEEALRHILEHGFFYNGIHYSRFGKSASQAKDGITAFVCDALFAELYRITQMDLPVDECIISKYEAQRCLVPGIQYLHVNPGLYAEHRHYRRVRKNTSPSVHQICRGKRKGI